MTTEGSDAESAAAGTLGSCTRDLPGAEKLSDAGNAGIADNE